jgi:hypothetical protein
MGMEMEGAAVLLSRHIKYEKVKSVTLTDRLNDLCQCTL